MKTMLLVVVFIFLSSYIGLFIRAKIEGVKIYKNIFDILSLSMIFFKFESLIKIFFISLKYKEKTYQKKVKSKVGEKFANYIGSELTQNKLMKKYAAI